MNRIFYGMWGIITFIISFYVVFHCGWEKEERRYSVSGMQYIPRVYYISTVRNFIHRIFMFSMFSILYVLFTFMIHFMIYGIQEVSSVNDYITRSITNLILLYTLKVQVDSIKSSSYNSEVNEEENDKNHHILKQVISASRFFCLDRVSLHEEKIYNKFLISKIGKLNKDKNLKNLFILKCQSDTWSHTLGIPIDTYRENIANRLWDEFEQDITFKEVVEDIFTKRLEDFDYKIIDVIKIFDNCQRKDVKGNEAINQSKIDAIIKERKSFKNKANAPINHSVLKEVDAEKYLQDA